MVLKSDQERIKALLKDTITLLCRNGLTFKTEFSIEALIGITLDQDDVLLVNINEIVRNELGHKLAAEAQDSNSQGNELGVGSGDWDDNYSDTASQHSMTPSSNSKRKRKRRKSAGQGSKGDQESDDGGGSDGGESYAGPGDDPSTLSEPLAKRNSMSTSRTKSAVKQEDDDSKDIVFIKEEVDSGDWASTSQGQEGFPGDLSGIPSSSNSTLNPAHQESFDFLQGNSLIPMGGTPQQNANLWSDMTGRQNITSPSTKRTSTVTSAGSAGPSLADDSQQTLTPETIKRNADFVEQILGSFGGKFPYLTPSAIYNFVLPSLQLPPTPENMSFLNEQIETLIRNDVLQHQMPDAGKDNSEEPAVPCLSHPDIKDEPQFEAMSNSFEETNPRDDSLTEIENIASNVEVQQVYEAPFPSVMERLQESQDNEQDTFAGVRLPSRREFTDTNFRVNCPVCDKMFSTYQGYMRHVDQHRGRFAFRCRICSRGFMTKDHLGNHLRGHTGEKLYCFCGQGFKSHQALRTHKKREHSDHTHIDGK